MLRSFVRSAYFKAAATFLISGAVLILFFNWVKATDFGSAAQKFTDTMMPIYIGCFITFIICPVYNSIVRVFYRYLTSNSGYSSMKLHKNVNDGPIETVKGRKRAMIVSRVVASALSMCLIIGLVFLFAYFVVPQVIQNVIILINTLPARMNAFVMWSEVHLARFPQVVESIKSIASSGTPEIIAWVQDHILKSADGGMSIAQAISSGVLSVFSLLKDIFIGLLISIYLLNYKETLFAIGRKLVTSCVSDNKAEGLYEFWAVLNETFIGFLVGRILDALIIGVLTYIVLLITGINMPLLIAVIVGVTNIIPFFGPFLGAIPSFILVLMDSPVKALWFLVIIVVIQQLDGNVIGPKVVGNAIHLPSFWVLMAVLIGGGLYGVLGMLLGAPVFAVIYRYIDKGAKRRLRRKDKPEETEDYYYLGSYRIDKRELFEENEHEKSIL